MIKKLIAGGIAGVALLAATMPVFAAGPYDAITSTGNNAAFEPSPYNSIQNEYNTALRFGPGGRIAIPGAGGQYSNDNSVVAPYTTGGSQSIVNPQGAF